MVRLGDF
jgi:hypothetical protein